MNYPFPSPVGDVGFKSCRWNPLRDNGETGFCGADGKTLSFVNRKISICCSNPYTASRGADYVTTTMDLLFLILRRYAKSFLFSYF